MGRSLTARFRNETGKVEQILSYSTKPILDFPEKCNACHVAAEAPSILVQYSLQVLYGLITLFIPRDRVGSLLICRVIPLEGRCQPSYKIKCERLTSSLLAACSCRIPPDYPIHMQTTRKLHRTSILQHVLWLFSEETIQN